MDRRFRVARCWSNQQLKAIGHLFSGDVVNVSAGENIDKEGNTYDSYFPHSKSFSLTNYAPGAFRGYQGRTNEHLLDLAGPVPEHLREGFDVVFNHTVLEHVFDVRKAFRNLCELSRDIAIVVVPFAQIQHDSPGYKDYWRLCPSGVRALYEENGLEVVYESCNEDADTAVYLFFVGSRHPERWRTKMPAFTRIEEAGAWIGAVRLQPGLRTQAVNLLRGLRDRLLRREGS